MLDNLDVDPSTSAVVDLSQVFPWHLASNGPDLNLIPEPHLLLPGCRAAVTGPAGSGKSRFLRLLTGELVSSDGSKPVFRKDCRVVILRSGFVNIIRDCVAQVLKNQQPGEVQCGLRPGVASDVVRTILSQSVQKPTPYAPDGRNQPKHPCSFGVVDMQAEINRCGIRRRNTPGPSDEEIDSFIRKNGMLAVPLPAHFVIEDNLIRLAVGAIAHWAPDVIVADDPTEGLETGACDLLEELLSELVMQRVRVFIAASNDRDFLDRFCDEVIDLRGDTALRLPALTYTKYLCHGETLRFHSFSLWQPRHVGLKATQATCAFASLVCKHSLLARARGEECIRLVDAGTGTGVISLLIAQELARAGLPDGKFSGWGVDVDIPAVNVATKNFSVSPWARSLAVAQSRFEEWEWPEERTSAEISFRVCVCNPPYCNASVVKGLSAHSEEFRLSRQRALERDHMPIVDICRKARTLDCSELWILWQGEENKPFLKACHGEGWQVAQAIDLRRSRHRPRAFATVFSLVPRRIENLGDAVSCVPQPHVHSVQECAGCSDSPSYIDACSEVLWFDDDGSPSRDWCNLVGSLYYWRLRRWRPEHLDCTKSKRKCAVSLVRGNIQ